MDITKIENIEFPQEKGDLKKSKRNIDSALVNEDSKNLNIYHLIRDLEVFNEYQLTTLDKLILYTLESRGEQKRPSHAELAWNCRSKVRTIQRHLNQLRNIGILHWETELNAPNWYYLNNDDIELEVLKTRIKRQEQKTKEKLDKSKFQPNWAKIRQTEHSEPPQMTDKELKEEINIKN